MIVLMVACQSNKKSDDQKSLNQSTGKSEDGRAESSSKESVKTVMAFLKWYRDKQEEFDQFHLVANAWPNYDSTKFYEVNFPETEKYLAKLKSSGYISDQYLDHWRTYFKEHDKTMKEFPINDGPPDGFSFDLVLLTQEMDFTLNAIDTAKLIHVNESVKNSIVKIDIMMRLGFSLSKIEEKWLIDEIDNLGLE